MKLHCLGTAGYHPNETRHTSCYFLPESGIVLDAGTGIFRLPKLIETDVLHILLSHAHLDHIAGLTFLLDVLFQRPVEQVVIWAEAKKLETIKNNLFAELVFPVPLSAEWRAIDSSPRFKIGDCEITWRTQDHPGGSVGYRLDFPAAQKRLSYLTDTTGDTSEEAIKWIRESDLLMHECYFRREHKELANTTGHTFSDDVANIARLARPARLLLTHVNPLDDTPETLKEEVCETFDGPVTLANDALEIEF